MTTAPSPLGVAAGLAASAIWGGALAVTRLGVAGEAPLAPADIALLRFTGPAVILLPVLVRAWPRLRRVAGWQLLVLLIGGGAPFVLVAGTGLTIAGAAEAGTLLPGTVPLCVALLSGLLGERLGGLRIGGLVIIGVAVVAVITPGVLAGGAGRWPGYALLLGAAVLAAGYTIALRRSGLGPWEAAAFVSVGSLFGLALLGVAALPPGVLAAPLREVATQAAFQGVASGVLAPVAFAAAVRRLGASQAAAFGSLSPGAACLSGFLLLGEVPDALTALAVIASGIGVVLVALPARRLPS